MSTVLLSNGKTIVNQSWINKEVSQINIESEKCSASISLYAGHVLQWKPKNHKPVFWLSENATFEPGKAIRGGIPICWPWFGPFPEEMRLTDTSTDINSHGFARTSQWVLKEVKETHQGVVVELVLSGKSKHPQWPFCFELTQVLIFSETFTQSLLIKNLGLDEAGLNNSSANYLSTQALYTGALHSYFAVGRSSETSISCLKGIDFEDKISSLKESANEKHQQTTKLNAVEQCMGPIDRIYQSAKDLVINDKVNHRIIKLTTNNAHQWVLWNPGVEIANKMADVHPNAENEFVCVEAANTSPITLPEGKEVSLSQHISVEHT